MKHSRFLPLLIVLLGFVACTTPTTDDFQSPTRPLSADEFVTIWRFPRAATAYEVQDTSQTHAEAMDRYMAPLFQQLIPRILADARTDKLRINEQKNETQMEDQPIVDLATALEHQHGASWQNLSPLMGAFHIIQRRKADTKGFLAQELELELVSQDPNQTLPERYFGSVRMDQLVELGYQIEFEGQVYDLRDYLVKCLPYIYPIHYRTLDFANGLVTLDQAFQTKVYVLEGRWNELEWLGSTPNLTDYQANPQPAEVLQALVGTYAIDPQSTGFLADGEGKVPEVEIRLVEDHLLLNWLHKPPYFSTEMFPISTTSFFNGNGGTVRFEIDGAEVRFTFDAGPENHISAVRK